MAVSEAITPTHWREESCSFNNIHASNTVTAEFSDDRIVATSSLPTIEARAKSRKQADIYKLYYIYIYIYE